MKRNLLIGSIIVSISVFTFFLASQRKNLQTINSSNHNIKQGGVRPEVRSSDADMFTKSTEALSAGWASIRQGDSYKRVGQYEKAIEAYKLAYETDPGNRLMSGSCLIETYAKLFQFDEALALVDDTMANLQLGEYGKQQYRLLRSRLLTAKTEVTQSMAQQLLQSHAHFMIGQYEAAEKGYIVIMNSLSSVASKAIVYDCLLDLYLALGDCPKIVSTCNWLIEHGDARDKIRGKAVKSRLRAG